MSVHLLMYNARGTSWDSISHETWRSILFRFAVPSCDGISFDTVRTENDLRRFDAFAEYQPAFIRDDQFRPNACPADSDPKTFRRSVAVFQFDQWTAKLMADTEFNVWNISNQGSDADEIVFWLGTSIKLHAISYEGQAYFHDLTAIERKRLLSSDASIEQHLYVV